MAGVQLVAAIVGVAYLGFGLFSLKAASDSAGQQNTNISKGVIKIVLGGCLISTVHANFIVNEGSATAAHVEDLIAHVHSTVKETTGISLELEVRIVGTKGSKRKICDQNRCTFRNPTWIYQNWDK